MPLSITLFACIDADKELCKAVAQQVGAAIGKMHDADVVHGDLTTSNIMMKSTTSSVTQRQPGSSANESTTSESIAGGPGVEAVLIDFGLGMMKPTIEDKAVDLYVLERAFISTHPGSEYMVW